MTNDSIANLLTNEIVRDAPTKKKAYTIRDGRGLFVLVHPNGSRYFQLRATVNGKRKLMQIGVYPQISIEEARQLAKTRLLEEESADARDKSEVFNLSDIPAETSQSAIEYDLEVPLVTPTTPNDELKPNVGEMQQVAPNKLTESHLIHPDQELSQSFHAKLRTDLNLSTRLKAMRFALAEFLNKVTQTFIGFRRVLFDGIDGIKNKKISTTPHLKGVFALISKLKVDLARHDQAKHILFMQVFWRQVLAIWYQLAKIARFLNNGLDKQLDRLTHLIITERQADREDVVSVYGLFAESKGNYLIYTIKSFLASSLG